MDKPDSQSFEEWLKYADSDFQFACADLEEEDAVYFGLISFHFQQAAENGVLAGYPLTDVKVTLYDGSYHDVDSSDIAFQIAGSMALQDGVKKASPVLLEPIMKVEVTTPDEFMGDVIGDLSAKRAQILGTNKRGNATIIIAMVPLAELSGYSTKLRSISQGRASYYMEPSHYEEVPKNIQEQITTKK